MTDTTDRPQAVSLATSRRGFLTAAAAVTGPLLVSPRVAFATEANSRVSLGLVGCGGRGTWIADLFQKHGGYQFVAAADYFQDKVDAFGSQAQVPAERRYSGLQGYARLLQTQVDAVVIESPPFFHPGQ